MRFASSSISRDELSYGDFRSLCVSRVCEVLESRIGKFFGEILRKVNLYISSATDCATFILIVRPDLSIRGRTGVRLVTKISGGMVPPSGSVSRCFAGHIRLWHILFLLGDPQCQVLPIFMVLRFRDYGRSNALALSFYYSVWSRELEYSIVAYAFIYPSTRCKTRKSYFSSTPDCATRNITVWPGMSINTRSSLRPVPKYQAR